MDGPRFDQLTRALATKTSRRNLLKGLVAGLAASAVSSPLRSLKSVASPSHTQHSSGRAQTSNSIAYYALGDSVASGHGLDDSGPGTCKRSQYAYPYQIAKQLSNDYGNVIFGPDHHIACSGATTADLSGQVTKVLNSLESEHYPYGQSILVTITIGANNFDWLSPGTLTKVAFFPDDWYANWISVITSQIQRDITTQVGRLVAARPNLAVVLTQYYNPLSPEYFVLDQLWRKDTSGRLYARFQQMIDALNIALVRALKPYASTGRVRAVPTIMGAFEGHGSVCGSVEASAADSWIQTPLDPQSNSLASFSGVKLLDGLGDCIHPNRRGAQEIANEAMVPIRSVASTIGIRRPTFPGIGGVPGQQAQPPSPSSQTPSQPPRCTKTVCSGQCVDLRTDRLHCGSCGNTCHDGMICQGSQCRCTGGRTECNGTCVDLATDLANCGSCGNVCGPNMTCANRACHCLPGLTDCSGTCRDLATDPENCGACGVSCNGNACVAGICTGSIEVRSGAAGAIFVLTAGPYAAVDPCAPFSTADATYNQGFYDILPNVPPGDYVLWSIFPDGYWSNPDRQLVSIYPGQRTTADIVLPSTSVTFSVVDKNGNPVSADSSWLGSASRGILINTYNNRCGSSSYFDNSYGHTLDLVPGFDDSLDGSVTIVGLPAGSYAYNTQYFDLWESPEHQAITSGTFELGNPGDVYITIPICGGYPANFEFCSHACADLATDPAHCGACGIRCDSGFCVDGVCCDTGSVDCGGVCRDLHSDANHCGSCGTACQSQPCVNGICGECGTRDSHCVDGKVCCHELCIPVDEALDQGCVVECIDGVCHCLEGRIECEGRCVDPAADLEHCGFCGMACLPDYQYCIAGECTHCPAGQNWCDGACIDILSDPLNCGGCQINCLSGGCIEGSCAPCLEHEQLCAVGCIDPMNDPEHCGGCGLVCSSGECIDGACTRDSCGSDSDCPANQSCCQRNGIGTCLDLSLYAACCDDGDCNPPDAPFNPCRTRLCPDTGEGAFFCHFPEDGPAAGEVAGWCCGGTLVPEADCCSWRALEPGFDEGSMQEPGIGCPQGEACGWSRPPAGTERTLICHQCFDDVDCGHGESCDGVLCVPAVVNVQSASTATPTPSPTPTPVATCVPGDCAALGLDCGQHDDGCGGTLDCGACCQPVTCSDLGLTCGPADDGCGGTLDCGPCCAPATCADLGQACGIADDGCGGMLDCGPCETDGSVPDDGTPAAESA